MHMTIRFSIIAFAVTTLACSAQPNYKSGQFACDLTGSRACPDGYRCVANLCYSNNDLRDANTGGAPGNGTIDAGADALVVSPTGGTAGTSATAGSPAATGGSAGTSVPAGGAGVSGGGAVATAGTVAAAGGTVASGGTGATGGTVATGGAGAGGTAGTGGTPAPACEAPLKDCDGISGNGCEDPRTDRRNCGTCGKQCAGDCVGGVCQPAILAENQTSLAGIAVDSDYVYWINTGGGPNTGTVARIKKTGKPAAVEVLSSAENRPCGIAVNLNGVYWTNRGTENGTDGAVRGKLKSGGAAFDIVTGQQMPCSIAVNLATAYWVNSETATVRTKIWSGALSASATPEIVYTPSTQYDHVQRIGIDASTLYFSNMNNNISWYYSLYRVPLLNIAGGATMMRQASSRSANVEMRVAVSGSDGFYTVNDGVVGRAGAGYQYEKSGLPQPKGVAADLKSVYWAQTGAIMRSPNPPVMNWDTATQLIKAASPTEIAIDDDNVYYLEPTLGQVMVAPR